MYQLNVRKPKYIKCCLIIMIENKKPANHCVFRKYNPQLFFLINDLNSLTMTTKKQTNIEIEIESLCDLFSVNWHDYFMLFPQNNR